MGRMALLDRENYLLRLMDQPLQKLSEHLFSDPLWRFHINPVCPHRSIVEVMVELSHVPIANTTGVLPRIPPAIPE